MKRSLAGLIVVRMMLKDPDVWPGFVVVPPSEAEIAAGRAKNVERARRRCNAGRRQLGCPNLWAR